MIPVLGEYFSLPIVPWTIEVSGYSISQQRLTLWNLARRHWASLLKKIGEENQISHMGPFLQDVLAVKCQQICPLYACPLFSLLQAARRMKL